MSTVNDISHDIADTQKKLFLSENGLHFCDLLITYYYTLIFNRCGSTPRTSSKLSETI